MTRPDSYLTMTAVVNRLKAFTRPHVELTYTAVMPGLALPTLDFCRTEPYDGEEPIESGRAPVKRRRSPRPRKVPTAK